MLSSKSLILCREWVTSQQHTKQIFEFEHIVVWRDNKTQIFNCEMLTINGTEQEKREI